MSTIPDIGRVFYGDASQILSNWPAGVNYNAHENKYVYSVASQWKIDPQAHLHVVDIDGSEGGGPYTMELQLPIISQLALGSRLYFFYVSNWQADDVLTFIPTTGSGDTVNGDPFSTSFTSATGMKQLFIAIAVAGNYLIHEFGKDVAPPDPPPPIVLPTVRIDFDNTKVPNSTNTISTPWSGAEIMFPGIDAEGAVTTVNPGMEGFLTSNVTTTGSRRAIECQQGGYYLVNPGLTGYCRYTVGASGGGRQLGPYAAGWYETLADNTPVGVRYASGFVPFEAKSSPTQTAIYWEYKTSFLMPMTAGHRYYPVFIWDNISAATIDLANCYIAGSMKFVYWSPLPATPAPMSFSAFSAARSGMTRGLSAPPSASSSSSSEISPLHKQLSVREIKKLQKERAQGQQQQQARGSSSSFSTQDVHITPPQPAFSLSDIERIVQQAMANAAIKSSEQAREDAQVARARKRRRTEEGSKSDGKEMEIL